MSYIRNLVVNTMREWVDNASFHEEVVSLYNTISPLPRGYVLTEEDNCDVAAISAVFQKLGYAGIFPMECNRYYLVANAVSLDFWSEPDARIPEVGDIILYTKRDSKLTGIVEFVGNGKITVIESSGNCVKYDKLKMVDSHIEGFIIPRYSSIPIDEPDDEVVEEAPEETPADTAVEEMVAE